MAESNRYMFEYPDEAGYPDGVGTLSQDQTVLIDEVIDDPHALEIDFYVVNDEENGIYEAIVGDTAIGGVPYSIVGDGRVVLLGTSVYPDYRNQGVGTELIRRVLDEMRTRGKTVTVMCPVVRTFIDHNPDYADLVDPRHPGVIRGAHRA
jgi:predicted GNAT family acetyltransferase